MPDIIPLRRNRYEQDSLFDDPDDDETDEEPEEEPEIDDYPGVA